MDAAVHVPTTRDKPTPRRDHLEIALARLRFAKAQAHPDFPRPTPGGLPARP